MASDSETDVVSSEPLPGIPMTVRMRQRAKTQRFLIRKLCEHPGWAVLKDRWEETQTEARCQLMLATDDSTARRVQAELKALDVPDELVREYEAAARAAEDRTHWAPGPAPIQERLQLAEFTDIEAGHAIEKAARVREMLALGGWALLQHGISARIWAYAAALREMPDHREFYQAQILGLMRIFGDVQECLDRGEVAAAWQTARMKESMTKGKGE